MALASNIIPMATAKRLEYQAIDLSQIACSEEETKWI